MGSSRRGRPSEAGLPPGFTLKRKTLANGTVAEYIYHRGGGRVHAKPGTPEFEAEVQRLTGRQETATVEGTWGKLVEIYKASPGYRALTVKTRAYYDRHLDRVRAFSALPLNQIRRRDLLAIRDAIAIDHPQAANQFVMVLGVVFQLALDRELIEHDPIAKVRRIPGGTHKTWTDEQLDHALTNFAEPYRRAVVLASHLGQRESDLVKMVWSDFDGTAIRVQQQKTGDEAADRTRWLPCPPELRAELQAWRGDADRSAPILTNSLGRKWPVNSFAQTMSKKISEHEPLAGLVFHGIRKAAARRLAEAGCTDHEIMAITGHESLKEVQRYTKGARQRLLAQSAMNKLTGTRN